MTLDSVPSCRQCGVPAPYLVALTKGCIVYPNDFSQWLCAQHIDRLTPLGDSKLVAIFTGDHRIVTAEEADV